jgi:competence ComEA-like helix-hairpin-helix protein
MRYTRPQLRLLLVLAVVMLVGLVIQEWRAGFPELAERLERFDREDPVDAPSSRHPASPPRQRASLARRPSGADAASEGPPHHEGHPGRGATASGMASRLVDLNRASEMELARLPGLGTGLARRIVEERDRHGAFDSPEALRRVYGLGPRKLAAIRDHVTVTVAAPMAGAPAPPEATGAADANPDVTSPGGSVEALSEGDEHERD